MTDPVRDQRNFATAVLSRSALLVPALMMLGAVWLFSPSAPSVADPATIVPPPAVDEAPTPGSQIESAVLAGGCFWGVQGVFQHVKGVTNAVSGYSGGDKATAHYQIVGSGTTGHAESVRVEFDRHQISYGRILQIYFSVAHDPTQLNRQGPDTGTQYRSAIFTDGADQAKIAKAYIAQLNQARTFDAAIVTKLSPLNGFYPAEGYHQNYLTLNPDSPYIVINDLPKIENLRRVFPDLYRADPVLVPTSATSN
jgi:peptide-methionine (S)-S-oxide reductase